jgi:hypothetical protein
MKVARRSERVMNASAGPKFKRKKVRGLAVGLGARTFANSRGFVNCV